ncbi:MAG: hypothetical protein HKN07_09375 [Acidimicrobiia bacterium]|nr:hypothetical protein [Acidimicrobiia bacterium]
MTKRTYQRDNLIVHWDSSRCIHSGRCLRGLPEVFDLQARPWVQLEEAESDAVTATIETCPSGALTYERVGGQPEQTPDVPTITPHPNGPLHVRGYVEVRDVTGAVFDAGPRMTLCRCGHSNNQPFCDNSHREAGFKDRARVISPERNDAQHPPPAT